tara:strand:- start:819 stop:1865 length:1047 start_codon:yes stop_codon:yes gene_type:complete
MGIIIDDKVIGDNSPAFIVAELSCNHVGEKKLAIETIRAAKKCGADAIKLQTYTPDTMTINSNQECFKIQNGSAWDGFTYYDLYQEAYTPWDWHHDLFDIAREEGLICFSSPFDFSAVEFLQQFDPPAYKIASFELVDIPLIEKVAALQKPVIMSTGIAKLDEIKRAVSACRSKGNDQIILLKCTSAYPAPYSELNLKTMCNMAETFGVQIGLSDHSKGVAVPAAAVALGAKLIEKHLILDKSIGGHDVDFSLDVDEFSEMVNAVRNVELALGRVCYDLSPTVNKSRRFGRSLFAVANIKKGEKFSKENIRSIRPGIGLAPRFFNSLIGKVANQDIERGTPMNWNLVK